MMTSAHVRVFLVSLALAAIFLGMPAKSQGRDGEMDASDGGETKSESASEEFDRPSSDNRFKTVPPEGPATSTYLKDRDTKVHVTNVLLPPHTYVREASDENPHAAPPGAKEASSYIRREVWTGPGQVVRSEVTAMTDREPSSSSEAPESCQYTFTVDNSQHCPHTKTEIAVEQVSPASRSDITTDVAEYFRRLGRLEDVVYSDRPENTNRNATRQSGEKRTLSTIAQLMREELNDLVSEILLSEKRQNELEAQNRNLILAIRRSTVARRNLVALKKELQKSLQKARDENVKLVIANRTITVQNIVLRKSKTALESQRDAFQQRIRALEIQNAELATDIDSCKEENMVQSNESHALKIRVGNLTEMVARYMEISRGEGPLLFELENEKEKNEILTVKNAKLVEDLANATNQIRKLVSKIPDIVKIPDHHDEKTPHADVPTEDATTRMEADSSTSTLHPGSEISPRAEEKVHTQCGKIVSVTGPETVRESISFLEKYGVWMTDPLQALGEDKVWAIDTIKERVKELKQFRNLRKFTQNQPENIITLPVPVESTGGVIYNGSFYYQRRNSRKIIRYDILSKTVLKERPVHHAGFHGMYAYQWGGWTDIDLAIDEYGLWVIYSTRQNKGNIVVTKLNHVTLRPLTIVKTPIPKRTVANAFMICGVLYTVDSYDALNTSINFAFDTHSRRLRRTSIPFANQYRYNVMIDYNPRRREIYSWDNHHQVKYYVTLDNSLGKIGEMSFRRRRKRRS